jgi:hypothetical protein
LRVTLIGAPEDGERNHNPECTSSEQRHEAHATAPHRAARIPARKRAQQDGGHQV